MNNLERKWVYESIAETVPPFSWLPRKYNILAQLIVMEIAGAVLWYIFALPRRTLLYGSISIFVVVVWSFLILQLAPTIRDLKHSLKGSEKEFLERYRSSLFSARYYELILGLTIFLAISAYLLYDRTLMDYWFGEHTDILLISFVMIFTFDVSYRMGVVLWVSLLAVWRSINLKKIIERGPSLDYIPYVDFWALQRLDSYNIIFVVVSLPMLITIWQDKFFTLAFFIGGSGTVVLNLLSIATLKRIPWLPSHVYDLVYNNKFAYVATCDEKGNPHGTPVSYVFDGRSIFFMTSITAKKLANIKKNSKLSFMIDSRSDSISRNEGVLFIGNAKVYGIRDLPLNFYKLLRVRGLFKSKYPEYTRKYRQEKEKLPVAWQLVPFVARILVEVKPRRIFYWSDFKQLSPLPPSKTEGMPQKMQNVIEQNKVGYLCVASKENQPYITPVFYSYHDSGISIWISRNSRKMKVVQENPKVALAIDVRDPIDPFRNEGVLIPGRAEAKEMQDKALVEIKPGRIVYWKGPKFERIKIEAWKWSF